MYVLCTLSFVEFLYFDFTEVEPKMCCILMEEERWLEGRQSNAQKNLFLYNKGTLQSN